MKRAPASLETKRKYIDSEKKSIDYAASLTEDIWKKHLPREIYFDRDRVQELIDYYRQAYELPKTPVTILPDKEKYAKFLNDYYRSIGEKSKDTNSEGVYRFGKKDIVLDRNRRRLLSNIAHEFMHAKEFAKDKKIPKDTHFKNQPKYSRPDLSYNDQLIEDQIFVEQELAKELATKKMLEAKMMERLTGGIERSEAEELLFPDMPEEERRARLEEYYKNLKENPNERTNY